MTQDHQEQAVGSLPDGRSTSPSLADIAGLAGDETPGLDLPRDWSKHWTVRWSQPEDFPALKSLFLEAFGADVGRDFWNWKYRYTSTWGVIVACEQELVAFFGGMPRTFFMAGQPLLGVQIGDVMVKPQERGTLSRQGPVFRATAAYFGNMSRLYPEVGFAFGFPHARALQLGLKLGVYAEVDAITQLAWDALPRRRNWRVRTREVGLAHGGSECDRIDALWQAMQRDWPGLLLPQRDAAYWLHRYAECPEQRYRVLLLQHRWTSHPVACIALRVHADYVEWLDYVGPRTGIDEAIRALRTFAGALGLHRVQGWFSSAIAECFGGNAKAEQIDVRIPVNAIGTPDAGTLPGRLWLMAGDTDFR